MHLSDKLKAVVSKQSQSGSFSTLTSSPDVTSAKITTYGSGGKTVTTRMPNYFDSTISGNTSYVVEKTFDLLGRKTNIKTPDSGVNSMIYDDDGQLRFSQDAQGAKDGYYSYMKYDALNRPVEHGYITGTWDPSTLQTSANDPAYPTGVSGQTVLSSMDYNTYADPLNGLGRLKQVKTVNDPAGANPVTVTEVFSYTADARVQSVHTTVADTKGTFSDTTVNYTYTGNGSVESVTYPSGAGIPKVFYSYDKLGRMTGVGTSATDPTRFAAYSYNPDSSISGKSLNAGKYNQTFSFHPPGWPENITDNNAANGFIESMPDYSPLGESLTIKNSLANGGNTSELDLNATYTKDNFLESATLKQKTDWNLSSITYDPDGNITALTEGATAETLGYFSGTNRVSTLSVGGSANKSFTYNEKGGVETVSASNTPSKSALTFDYVKGGFLTQSITFQTGGDILGLSYGSKHRRAMKRLTDSSGNVKSEKVYIHGVHPLPLMTVENKQVKTYIYGKNDLLAVNTGGETYAVVQDHLGSNAVLLDSTGAVKQGVMFSPYGKMDFTAGGGTPLLDYLYTGQEFDSETGLYHFMARLYDPDLKRFYYPDPKGQFSGVYVYTGGNPLDQTDPTGEWVIDLIAGLLSTAMIIGGVAAIIASGGAATPAVAAAWGIGGSTLSGGGLGLGSTLGENLAEGKPDDIRSEGIGLAVGLITGFAGGGTGALGDLAAAKVTGFVVQTATKAGIAGLNGMAVGVIDKGIENVAGLGDDDKVHGFFKDYDKSLLSGLGAGVIGSVVGSVGEDWIDKGSKDIYKGLRASALGILGGGLGGLTSWAVDGGQFKWVDFSIAVSIGAVEALPSPLKKVRQEALRRPRVMDSHRGVHVGIPTAWTEMRTLEPRTFNPRDNSGDYSSVPNTPPNTPRGD